MKSQLALPSGQPIIRKRVLLNTSLTSEEIREAQIIAAVHQEMEIEMEFYHGKYPCVERRY